MFERQISPCSGVFWSLLAMLVAGCAASGTEPMESSKARPPKQAITVIRSNTFLFDWDKEIRPVRANLERCAATAVNKHFPDLRYISRADFIKTAFPNLPIDSAPTDLRYVRVVLESPTIRHRLEPINLRYIIYVGGKTEIEASHSWVVVGGYMAATAAGFSTWEKDTDVNALVFDLQNPKNATRSEEHSEGTSWVAGLFPFVIGMSTASENRACNEIGKQLVNTLAAARRLEQQK